MNKALKTRITNLMRKDLRKTPQYNNAKKRHFKGRAVYQCPSCEKHFYTGSSDKNYELLIEEYKDLIKCKEKDLHMDHVEPLVPYDKDLDSMSLEEIAERVYCWDNEENLSYICKQCHTEKTSKEKSIRSKYKKLKKLEEK